MHATARSALVKLSCCLSLAYESSDAELEAGHSAFFYPLHTVVTLHIHNARLAYTSARKRSLEGPSSLEKIVRPLTQLPTALKQL